MTFSVIEDLEFSVSVPSGVKSEIILKDLEACSSIVHVLSTMLLPELASGSENNENSEGESQSNDQNDEGDSSNEGEDKSEDYGEGDKDEDKSGGEEGSTPESNVEGEITGSCLFAF